MARKQTRASKLSLHPLDFKEAVSDILKAKPVKKGREDRNETDSCSESRQVENAYLSTNEAESKVEAGEAA